MRPPVLMVLVVAFALCAVLFGARAAVATAPSSDTAAGSTPR